MGSPIFSALALTPVRTAMHDHIASRTAPTLRPLIWAVGLALGINAWAADPATDHGTRAAPAASAASAASAPAPATQGADIAAKKAPVESLPTTSTNPMAEKIRAAMAGTVVSSKKMTVTVEDKEPLVRTAPASAPRSTPAARALSSRSYSRARAAAVEGHAETTATAGHGGDVHWSYEGEGGPQAWGKLKPDFNVCAIGKRQSPINIEDGHTLQGPAEPVQFAYVPSNATVVNNGHTIQVDVQGDNSITVRGSNYRLLQFHFHTPSEEQINFKRFPMVAHLVHKNNEGQLAVIAVLLDEGASNPVIDKVWTYMPLDANDRVRMPAGLLNLSELLPTDQRYYQFMGSLTTPPCTEGVLWMVMKQPVTISKAQYKLFTQLYPANARPVQPLNGRPVREAQ
ncbi:MAG: carbonic anhydrase family protein [Burkholderiales bacterium]|nr:carbonic anhydrase family protein [Burkholderiales bacterium]